MQPQTTPAPRKRTFHCSWCDRPGHTRATCVRAPKRPLPAAREVLRPPPDRPAADLSPLLYLLLLQMEPVRLFGCYRLCALPPLTRAQQQMVHKNLGLVRYHAFHLPPELQAMLPIEDLLQEGAIGLMKAAQRFDPDLGCRFSTYASWWVKHHLYRALQNLGREVRLPVWQQLQIWQARKEGRPPPAHLLRVRVSLDQPALPGGEAEELRLSDLLPDDRPPATDGIERSWRRRRIEEALSSLQPLEAEVVRRRYGLDGQPEETLQVIGDRYGLSRERIRQLEHAALRQVRGVLEDVFFEEEAEEN